MSKVIQIEVINVAGPTAVGNARGGTYNVLEIAYKQDGKVQGKKLLDFTAPEVFAAAAQLKPKDIANVTIAKEPGKDGKEYWNWKEVSTGEAVRSGTVTSGGATAPVSTVSKPASAGRVTGSNYETPDERAAKQQLIVRQSSVTAALKFFEQTEADVSRQEVVELAEFFKDYVYNGVTKPAEKPKASKASKVKVADAADEVADDGDVPF